MGYLKLANRVLQRSDPFTVQSVQLSEPEITCFHRPGHEAGARWLYGDGGPDPDRCTCCGAPVRPDAYVGGLCPVCLRGYPHAQGSGHLLRLALDLGARPLARSDASRCCATSLRCPHSVGATSTLDSTSSLT